MKLPLKLLFLIFLLNVLPISNSVATTYVYNDSIEHSYTKKKRKKQRKYSTKKLKTSKIKKKKKKKKRIGKRFWLKVLIGILIFLSALSIFLNIYFGFSLSLLMTLGFLISYLVFAFKRNKELKRDPLDEKVTRTQYIFHVFTDVLLFYLFYGGLGFGIVMMLIVAGILSGIISLAIVLGILSFILSIVSLYYFIKLVKRTKGIKKKRKAEALDIE